MKRSPGLSLSKPCGLFKKWLTKLSGAGSIFRIVSSSKTHSVRQVGKFSPCFQREGKGDQITESRHRSRSSPSVLPDFLCFNHFNCPDRLAGSIRAGKWRNGNTLPTKNILPGTRQTFLLHGKSSRHFPNCRGLGCEPERLVWPAGWSEAETPIYRGQARLAPG